MKKTKIKKNLKKKSVKKIIKKNKARKKLPLFFLPFYWVGFLTLRLLILYKNSLVKSVTAIFKVCHFTGRLSFETALLVVKILLFFCRKIGHLILFLVVITVRLPALPFLLLWESWLMLTNPEIKKQKQLWWQSRWQVFVDSFSSFKRGFELSPDPGIRFCYALVRSPQRFLLTALLIFGSASGLYFWVLKDLPSPYKLKQPPALSTRIYARDCQTLLYKIYRNENRTLIKLDQIPQVVRQATLAIEDKEFYRHHGFSLTGILRAFKNNLENRRIQGGSTITQQLIKNAVLSSERTYTRKFKELLLSLQAEMIFTKDQILQMYLNEVAYGGPAYGIEEAAEMYFGKSVKDLDLAEAAFLAGLPAAPSKFSPYLAGITAAKARQKEVLEQMVKAGFITAKDAKYAYLKELKILPPNNPIKAPHFVMFVKDELIKLYGEEKVNSGGLTVCTTLDPEVQALAEEVVSQEIGKIRQQYHVNNGAALVTNPATGEILAMVGSADFWDEKNDGNVNLTVSPRQPGSAIKLINYAYALAHGFSPSTILQDTPVSYRNAWETYTPRNYDGKFRGPVSLRSALAMSLNVPAVKTLASYGVEKMINQAKAMGITTWNKTGYGLSLTLGAAEVKMTDMAVAYGTIANMGKRVNLKPFRKIFDAEGRVLADIEAKDPNLRLVRTAEAAEAENQQVVPAPVAYQLIDILSDNEARTPAFGPNSDLYIKKAKVAVKTGTSNDLRDNWTIGFTPNLLVASWVGNNNNQPMAGIASGITGASPIWHKIIDPLLDKFGAAEFATPSGLLRLKICATTGTLTCPGCPREKYEYFLPGTEPKKACSLPKPEECQTRKAQMEAAGRPAEEIVAALANCPLATPFPQP